MEGDYAGFSGSTLPEISIHSLRMEGDCIYYSTLVTHVISIHSLRMEGDRIFAASVKNLSYFNPLPPHGGRLTQK